MDLDLLNTQIFVLVCEAVKVQAMDEVPYSLIEMKSSDTVATIIDNSELNPQNDVKNLSIQKGDVVVNGGYYSKEYKSLGYLKINGVAINSQVNPGLSGMLSIKSDGLLGINWSKNTVVGDYVGILQNGPFLVYPGGKFGINTDDGRLASRVCVGRKLNGNIIIVYSAKDSLFNLASVILKRHPDFSELLNMDGGPMAGVWSHDNYEFQFNNLVPAISYLKFSIK